MKHKPPYRATLSFDRASILYDIDFISWKIARTRIADAVAQSHFATDEEAHIFLGKEIEAAIDNIYGKLRWCTATEPYRPDALDNKPGIPTPTADSVETDAFLISDEEEYAVTEGTERKWLEEYPISFYFSPEWKGSIRTLRTTIHKYIVHYCLAQWFALVKPDEEANELAKAEELLMRAYYEARSEDVEHIRFIL